jgi:hypothetical protein
LGRIETLIGKAAGELDADEVARGARLVWSAVHGIAQIATTPKLGPLPVAMAVSMAEQVVDLYFGASLGKQTTPGRREAGRHAEHNRRA